MLLFTLGMILLGKTFWGFLHRRWQAVLFVLVAALLTIWICLSQLFLSIHFVTDIIGGIAGGVLIGWLTCKAMRSETKPPILTP